LLGWNVSCRMPQAAIADAKAGRYKPAPREG